MIVQPQTRLDPSLANPAVYYAILLYTFMIREAGMCAHQRTVPEFVLRTHEWYCQLYDVPPIYPWHGQSSVSHRQSQSDSGVCHFT